MLDIKFIKENKDIIKEGAKKKHIETDIDGLIAVDDKRLALLLAVEGLRGEQNKMNNSIAVEKDFNVRSQMINEMRIVKEDLTKKEEELKTIIRLRLARKRIIKLRNRRT